jgi:hypothetical protein
LGLLIGLLQACGSSEPGGEQADGRAGGAGEASSDAGGADRADAPNGHDGQGLEAGPESGDDATTVDGSLRDGADQGNDGAAIADAVEDPGAADDRSGDAGGDQGVAPDASVSEASAPDASASDASVSDASVSDASVSDASVSDASAPDASASDASVSDAHVSDAHVSNEASAPDSAADAAAPDAGCPVDFTQCSVGCCRGFLIERVDPVVAGGGASPISLAFDAQGEPHLIYVDPAEDELIYATRAGTSWTFELVDDQVPSDVHVPSNDHTVGLAVDGRGAVHVVYLSSKDSSLRYARRAGGTWTKEVADDGGSHSNAVSIGVDAGGVVHLSYFESTNGYLGHATRSAAGVWTFEKVDSGGVGTYSSLALDGAGRPRISYWDYTNGHLKYAAWDGSAWNITPVDTAGNVGIHTSLALDASGQPRIAYQDATTFSVKYAEWTGSTWVVTSPPMGHDSLPHLAIDGAGNPWISDYGYDLYRPRLSHRVGSTWVKETFASDDPAGQPTAVAREPSGNVALAYTGSPGSTLRLARLSSGAWTNETVDEYREAGQESQLALDGAGLAHISYLNNTRHEVWYATRDAQGAWTRRSVRAVGNGQESPTGGHTSIAVEPGGTAHIVWYNAANKSVEHGVWSGSSWNIEVVDSPSSGAVWSSIALDAAGQARIAYINGNFALLYASRNAGGTYAIETVVPGGAFEVSLALDSLAVPHISYYDAAAKTIAYASRATSGWLTETVDSSDGTYAANRIVLDVNDNPHLCYEKLMPGVLSSLGYATRSAGGTWTKGGPSFPNDNAGGDCSIALDAQGQPHISHSTGFAIYYSRLQGGTWINLSLEAPLTITGFTSIALDGNGTPQISYYNITEHQLRYARQK